MPAAILFMSSCTELGHEILHTCIGICLAPDRAVSQALFDLSWDRAAALSDSSSVGTTAFALLLFFADTDVGGDRVT